MRQLSITLLVCLLAPGRMTWAEAHPAQPPRLALVISISNFRYHPPMATADDGRRMASLLRRQGFDVDSVSNEKATVAGVRAAFDALIQRVSHQPGAVVVVYVSSHGASIANENNRDDPEPDGFDEAIVCHDSPVQPTARQVIIDDQVGHWFDAIRSAIGPAGQLVYFLDACYANTGIRGDARRLIKFVGPAVPGSRVSTGDFDLSAGVLAETRSGYGKLVAYFAADEGKEARILPGSNMSAMTCGLYHALLTIGPGRTYRDLFQLLQIKTNDAVRKVFHNDSMTNPVFIMGSPNVGDEKLFSGRFTPMNAVLIEPRRLAASGGSVKIPRRSYGTTKGSVYRFQRGDTTVARGIVREQDENYDYVSLMPTKTAGQSGSLEALTATVEEFNYQELKTTVALSLSSPLLQRELHRWLQQWGSHLLTVATPGQAAQILVQQTGKHIQFYQAADGSVVAPPVEERSPVLALAEQIEQQLRNIALYRLLDQLEPESAQPRVKMTLHRATIQRLYLDRPIDKRDRTHPGQDYTRVLHRDDTLAFRQYNGLAAVDTSQQAVLDLHNTTADSLYFNLLDVDPLKNITLFWPSPDDSRIDDPTSFLLKPHEKKAIPLTDFNPPFGLEEFRLITSRHPIDLRDFLNNQRRQGQKGNGSPSWLGSTSVFRYYILPSK